MSLLLEDPNPPEEQPQIQSYRDLWASVLQTAVTDLAGKNYLASQSKDDSASNFWRHTARDWVQSDAVFTGSFVWICGVLDLDYVDVRRRLLTSRFRLPAKRLGIMLEHARAA